MCKAMVFLVFCAALSFPGNLLFAQNYSRDSYLMDIGFRSKVRLLNSSVPDGSNIGLYDSPFLMGKDQSINWKYEDVSVRNDSLFVKGAFYARYLKANGSRILYVYGFYGQDLIRLQWTIPDNNGKILYVFTFLDTKHRAAISVNSNTADIMLYAIAKNELIENGNRINVKAEEEFIKDHPYD